MTNMAAGKGIALMPISSLAVVLQYGIVKPTLILRPPFLLEAIRLQMALFFAGGKELASCQQCGRKFELGADGKRSVAKFCSDQCRNRYHYERRAGK
jgi:hypothetical protein